MANQNKLVIGENSWEGFQGMFVYYNQCEVIGYYYKINGIYYNATSLIKEEEEIDSFSYHSGFDLMDSFTIDSKGSEILFVNISGQGLLYQQLSDGVFVDILPTVEEEHEVTGEVEDKPYTLKVPLPNGKDINGVFEQLLLTSIDETIIEKIEANSYNEELEEHTELNEKELLQILNNIQ